MKRFKLLVLGFLALGVLCGCGKKETETDAQKFLKEYTTVSENNPFVYKSSEEIINILENGTGLIYLGFPECPWCQAYLPFLEAVADQNDVNVIYYFNIYEDRKNNTDDYKKIVELLSEYLKYDDEGLKRIYVPAIIAVNKGEIVGFDDETSLDTKGTDDPSKYWTDDEVKELKDNLNKMIEKIEYKTCTDCNL